MKFPKPQSSGIGTTGATGVALMIPYGSNHRMGLANPLHHINYFSYWTGE